MEKLLEKFKLLINTEHYGNNLIEWGICCIGIVFSFFISKFIFLIFSHYTKKILQKTKITSGERLVNVVEKPVIFLLTILCIKYSLNILALPKGLSSFNQHFFAVLTTLILGFGLYKFFNTFADLVLLPLCKKTTTKFDDQILIIARKSVNISIVVGTILFTIQSAGKDIDTLLAGLGLGGLAFALAAQETIANFFGGITLIADKPFKINDRVQVEEHDGIITDIGFRSTRIKTFLEEKIITIPNSIFANKAIKNMTTCDSLHRKLTIGLIYSTGEEKMKLAISLLKKIIEGNEKTENKSVIFFETFNNFSLDIEINYYIKKSSNQFEAQSEINLKILKTFNENKLEFAFPTQTLFAQIEKN